jgi:hypothetical protein
VIGLKQLLSNEPLWKRPIPICGSVYSKIVFLISLNYVNQFLNPQNRYSGPDTGMAVFGVLFFAIGGAMIGFELYSIRKQRNQAAADLY